MGSDVHVNFDSKPVGSDLKRFKCPNCGASIVEGSRFCVFCGAAVQADNTQRAEVRIEDVAEVQRADNETRMSYIREKEMVHDLRWKLFKRYLMIAWFTVGIILFVIGLAIHAEASKTGNKNTPLALGISMLVFGGMVAAARHK